MYKEIEILEKLTKEDQSSILSMISSSTSNLTPIEIDSVVYEIPFPVYDLIDSLALQIKEMSVL
jgi:hypothetical protein